MTDDDPGIVTDPNGIAYPTSVQRFLLWHGYDDHSGYPDPTFVTDLVAALESVAAVAREHPAPADPDAGDDDPTVRLGLFTNGFASGITTYLQNIEDMPRDDATRIALAFTTRVFSDPIMRLQMLDELAGYDPTTASVSETYFTSHPAHPPHEGDSPT